MNRVASLVRDILARAVDLARTMDRSPMILAVPGADDWGYVSENGRLSGIPE